MRVTHCFNLIGTMHILCYWKKVKSEVKNTTKQNQTHICVKTNTCSNLDQSDPLFGNKGMQQCSLRHNTINAFKKIKSDSKNWFGKQLFSNMKAQKNKQLQIDFSA